jgi:diguanylate cyclase (GGDEF)-like protein
MLRAKQAVGLTSEAATGRGVASPSRRRNDRRMDAGKLQQAILEIAFDATAPDALVRRSLEVLQEAFAEAAVVVSLAQEGTPQLAHHALDGLAADLHQDGEASPAAAAFASGKSICVSDLGKDTRYNTATRTRGWLACCAEPLLAASGDRLGAVSLYFKHAKLVARYRRLLREHAAPLLSACLSARPAGAPPVAQPDRFASLAATIPGVVYQRIVNPQGDIRYTYISEGAREFFGVAPEEIIKNPDVLFRTFSEEYKASFKQRLLAASQALTTWDVEASIVTPEGRIKYTHAIARPERLSDGSVLWTGVTLDATRIKEAETAAAQMEARTRTAIVESLSQGFLLYDAADQLVIRNSHFLDLYPNLREQAQPGARYSDVVYAELASGEFPMRGEPLALAFESRLAQHKLHHSAHERQLGTNRWIQINEHRTSDGGTVVLYTDISELKRREQHIRHMAEHDGLTGLPNRVLFRQRVEDTIAVTKRSRGLAAVMCLDIDHFKNVNDTLGHPIGDQLLCAIAERLEGELRSEDTAARLGGDEFAIIVRKVTGPEAVASLATRLLVQLNQPILIDGQQIMASTSIGIALIDHASEDADCVIKSADLALYRAKADGRATYRFFDEEMDHRAQRRRALEMDLRQAIADEQLALHYQPLVDIAAGQIIGVEALVRWHHPRHGQVSPADFIPIAEETGLIDPLGEWVLQRACTDALAWPEHMTVAINLSPAQFRRRDFAHRIAKIISESGINPCRIEFEITESLLLRDTENNLEALSLLKKLGIRISMDDFGTGYSSLSNLRSFAFDKIKIDRSFIQGILEGGGSSQIVRTVLSLGRSLGLKTTAEGVETDDQLRFLAQEGCDEAQGYYYSPAVPVAKLMQLLLAPPTGAQGKLAANGAGVHQG